jgi:hypothetical protein
MTPGTLFTDICQFKKELIQAYFSNSVLKKRGMGSWSARRNYNSV